MIAALCRSRNGIAIYVMLLSLALWVTSEYGDCDSPCSNSFTMGTDNMLLISYGDHFALVGMRIVTCFCIQVLIGFINCHVRVSRMAVKCN